MLKRRASSELPPDSIVITAADAEAIEREFLAARNIIRSASAILKIIIQNQVEETEIDVIAGILSVIESADSPLEAVEEKMVHSFTREGKK